MAHTAGRRGADAPLTCPYLALARDRSAHSAIPTIQNRCYQDTARPYAVSLEHQGRFCFTNQHAGCPAYATGWRKLGRDAREGAGAARESAAPRVFGGTGAYWSQGLILLVLVLAMFGALLFGAPGLFSPSKGDPRATPTPTLPAGIQFPGR